jgi:glucose-1-phosphate thymidylyltransferase
MQIIIPMAGYGKRLRPHTFSRPKPMLNVAGEPILKHLLDSLEPLEISEFIFIVGHLGDQIEDYIRANYKLKSTFVMQTEMMGQSHAIWLARDTIQGPVVLVFADTLFETDLSVINTTDADAIVFVKEVDDPRRFGVVELGKGGRVTRFIEKPSSVENKQALVGLYYLRDSGAMLKAIETQITEKTMTKNEFFIADAFQIMVDNGAVFRTQPVSTWLDCGKPETILDTNRYLLDHGHATSSDLSDSNVAVIAPVYIDPSARIANSVIGPHATISANCRISHSIVRNSIIDTGAEVRNMILERSLVGRDAHVVGHLQTLNIGDESTLEA